MSCHGLQVDRSVWEAMQAKAEEKRKGYTCVVWAEREVTREMLAALERRSTEGPDVDDFGERCIEVSSESVEEEEEEEDCSLLPAQ